MAERKRKFDLAECYDECDLWLKSNSFVGMWLGRLIHEVARLRGLLSIGRVALAMGLRRETRLRVRNAKLETENRRLRGMKAPTGELSREQQALAWEMVWSAAWEMGMRSFWPTPKSTNAERVVQWMASLQQAGEVKQLRAEIVAMLSTGLLLNARWVDGWCLVHPGSNFDTQYKRLVELGAWECRSDPDNVECQFDEQNNSYRPIESQEPAESEVGDDDV